MPIVLRAFIALIAKEFCFLELFKKLKLKNLIFLVFFVQFVFECRFFSSLNVLWHLCRVRVHNCWYNCLVLSMGNFVRVVSGILSAMFFLRSVHTFSWFLESNWSCDFGYAATGSGAEKRVVLRREIFFLL